MFQILGPKQRDHFALCEFKSDLNMSTIEQDICLSSQSLGMRAENEGFFHNKTVRATKRKLRLQSYFHLFLQLSTKTKGF